MGRQRHDKSSVWYEWLAVEICPNGKAHSDNRSSELHSWTLSLTAKTWSLGHESKVKCKYRVCVYIRCF
jgi:hypothetical protein